MPDNISANDLLDKLDKYHNEIVKLARETTSSVETLKAATDIVNNQKNSNWSKLKTVAPLLLGAMVIIGILIMKPAGICSIAINAEKGVEIKRCEQKADQPTRE